MMQGVPGVAGVSVNAQMQYDPFVINQQQKDWYTQLFHTMVREKDVVDFIGYGQGWVCVTTGGSWIFHAEWFADEWLNADLSVMRSG